MNIKDLKGLTSKEKILIGFMESTIKKVNICLSSLYTLEKILIEKQLIKEQELISRLRDDLKLPVRKIGLDTLESMINDINAQETCTGKDAL